MRIGQPLIHLARTDSTNSALLDMLAETPNLSEGTTVITDQQIHGRGRQGRQWFAADDALACSILLKPATPLSSIPALSLLAAVAVWQALQQIIPSARIKWPNDILVGEAKLCGILTESRIIQGKLLGVVVGIGININTPANGWPADLGQSACSVNGMAEQTPSKQVLSRETCTTMILDSMDHWYHCWLAEGFEPIRELWQTAHGAHGRHVTVRTEQQQWQGIACGLADDGALLLRTEFGMQRIICGEVMVTA